MQLAPCFLQQQTFIERRDARLSFPPLRSLIATRVVAAIRQKQQQQAAFAALDADTYIQRP